ncbi:MAG: HupE/UreJ family protein [Hyphomicrobiaceae bacterium]
MTSVSRLRLGALALAFASVATPALAHHVMDGNLPTTLMQGLLSGLGHPIIGLDHLAFVVALGIGAALLQGPLVVIAAFVTMSIAGVLIHLAQLDIPMIEPLVSFSVLLAGLALIWSRSVAGSMWFGIAAVAGLLHGYAFGESIVGAERAVVGAYLLGLAIVMAAIALSVAWITRRIVGAEGVASPSLRVAGAVVGCVGAALLVSTLLPG